MSETQDTRLRILDAAERLFTEGGEAATSLRAITRAASVNVAAVHYHFGGRDGLLRAVLDRIVGPLNERRFVLLDEAEERHGDGVVPPDELLAAFLRPDLELLARLRREQVQLARFLGRAYIQPGPELAGFIEGQFQPLGQRLIPLLQRALPQLTPVELTVRMRLVVAIVTNLFATAPDPDAPGPLGTDDVAVQLRRLLDFCAAGFAAPAGQGSAERSSADARHPSA